MTYFLRFPDEATFHSACREAGLWLGGDIPGPFVESHEHTLDVIGPTTYVKAVGNSINWSDDDGGGLNFDVGLTEDRTGWVYSASLTEDSELLLASYSVGFCNQNTCNSEVSKLELSTENGELIVNRLVFDTDSPDVLIGREPATNAAETLGPKTDGWHVNAKFNSGLPPSWEAYAVNPSCPVRKFAGD